LIALCRIRPQASVKQQNAQEQSVNLKVAVVFDEFELPEFVPEIIDDGQTFRK
jgi:hypothetical protein